MNPLVSIIVPVYKVEKYLDECVESLVNQTYSNIEIILVDDGSPDNCPQLCNMWSSKDERIRVIHKPNGGVSSARNAGIDISTGEWIWFVDSDDTVELNALSELSQNFDEADLIVFNAKINKFYEKDESFFDEYYFKYQFGFEPWNKLYKKSIIAENELSFDAEESIGEDLLFNITYYQYANLYVFTDSRYYNYRIRENSAMQSGNEKRLEQQLRLYSKIFALYNKTDERILAQLLIMHLISGINQTGKQNIDRGKCDLILYSIEKYSYNNKIFKSALKSFFKSENASIFGRIRQRLFFYLIKRNIKIAIKII